jgi:excisionase family DNA binding protein
MVVFGRPRIKGGRMDDEFMTVDEVATYLRLCTNTVYKYLRAKKIPAARLGTGKFLIRRKDIEAILKAPPVLERRY